LISLLQEKFVAIYLCQNVKVERDGSSTPSRKAQDLIKLKQLVHRIYLTGYDV